MSLASLPSQDGELLKIEVLKCAVDSITFDNEGNAHVSSQTTRAALERAAAALRDDALVAFPTETVYGLGASALSSPAVKRIYTAKGRPADNPLIVHISHPSMLSKLVSSSRPVPKSYDALMRCFWPGPLTLLFPTDSFRVPDATTCGLPTIAVRMPAHPVARALIALAGVPVAAPSANRSGRPSPTAADHVVHDLGAGGRLGLTLDGGECGVGVESTVVDGLAEDGAVRVLRLGGVGVEEIEACLEEAWPVEAVPSPTSRVNVFHKDFRDAALEAHPTTPGMKYRHYSPDAKVIILDPQTSTTHTPGTHGLPLNGISEGQGKIPTLLEILDAQPEAVLTAQQGKTKVSLGLMLLDNGLLRHAFPSSLTLPPIVSSPPFLSPPTTLRAILAPGDLQLSPSTCSTTLHLFSLGFAADATDAARRLFAGLRLLDELGCDVIFVERVDEAGVGAAVMERTRKAAGGGGGMVSVRAS